MKPISTLVVCLVIAGCANPVSRYETQAHWNAAIAARDAGDWRVARREWSRVLGDGVPAGLSHTRIYAIALYEHGRAAGILCDWDVADSSLNAALALDRKLNGPIQLSMIELGRLNLDRGRYEDALKYFDEADVEIVRLHVETQDPLGYANYLDEYAIVLDHTGARDTATAKRSRANDIRKVFPDGKAISERTPYGSQCQIP